MELSKRLKKNHKYYFVIKTNPGFWGVIWEIYSDYIVYASVEYSKQIAWEHLTDDNFDQNEMKHLNFEEIISATHAVNIDGVVADDL